MTWRTTSASDAGVVARLRLGSERCGLFKGCIARQGSGCLVTWVQGRGGRSIAGWSACRAWPVRRNQSSGAAWAVPSPEDRGSRWRVAPVRGGAIMGLPAMTSRSWPDTEARLCSRSRKAWSGSIAAAPSGWRSAGTTRTAGPLTRATIRSALLMPALVVAMIVMIGIAGAESQHAQRDQEQHFGLHVQLHLLLTATWCHGRHDWMPTAAVVMPGCQATPVHAPTA